MYVVPLDVLTYEACLETVGEATSGAVKSRVNAVGVVVPLEKATDVLSTGVEGSSTSFSACDNRALPSEIDGSPGNGASVLVVLGEGLVRADKGIVESPWDGALIEACAVLADTEDVGGPEEKIDLLGVLKRFV